MTARVRPALAALVIVAAASTAAAQTPVRRVTTIDALRQYPAYFHLENVLLHGELAEAGARMALRAGEREIPVLLKDVRAATGLVEVRAQLIDVGRLEPGDPRLAGYEGAQDPDRWPRPGEDLVLRVIGVTEVQPATTPSVRLMALQPWRFEGQTVTVTGQFRGRNLYGDLPSAPGKSRYDFVLRSADAAVWVTGLRPRGRGFDLSVDARVDTGRWLQVTGVVSRERGLVAIAATAIATAEAEPDAPGVDDEPAAAGPPPEPAEVVFSSPVDGEVDVAPASTVRVQFSRGLDPASLTGRIRVAYVGAPPAGEPSLPPLEFQQTYDAATRAIEIRFTRALDRFRTVRVELLEGIRTFDGAPVTPWSLTFSLGG